MEMFVSPVGGLNADEAINGQYGPMVLPSVVQAADGADAHPGPMAIPGVAHVSSILIWWFILLGLCVAFHVITLRGPQN